MKFLSMIVSVSSTRCSRQCRLCLDATPKKLEISQGCSYHLTYIITTTKPHFQTNAQKLWSRPWFNYYLPAYSTRCHPTGGSPIGSRPTYCYPVNSPGGLLSRLGGLSVLALFTPRTSLVLHHGAPFRRNFESADETLGLHPTKFIQ